MTEKVHWKKLHDPDYFGAYSLGEKIEMDVVITKVVKSKVKNNEGKAEDKIVGYLKDNKPLIINPTNCKTIEKVLGTAFIDDWAGKKITVFRTKIKAFGEIVEAIRVRPTAPKKEVLNPTHPRWVGAVKAIADKSVTMVKLKEIYEISATNEGKLNGKV